MIDAEALAPFWTRDKDALSAELRCGTAGLSAVEAAARLVQYGPNADAAPKHASVAGAVWRRLLEPLSLILLAAGIVSAATGDGIGGAIIVTILVLSIGLDTFQEGRAVKAAEILRRSVALKAEVKRDGAFVPVEVDTVVPGDVMRVRAGDIIPADALVLEATAFTASEAALTGEPYPVEKRPGVVTARNAGEATQRPVPRRRRPDRRGAGAGRRHGPRDAVRRGRVVAGRKSRRPRPSSATCTRSAC